MDRAIAISAGIAGAFCTEYVLGLPWYVGLTVGALAYFLARYAIWAIAENRRFKAEQEELLRKYRGR